MGRVLCCALLFAATAAVDRGAWAAEEWVIPPGQEELLAAMLGKGATLPGDCKLTDGKVEHKIVKATYGCPGGEVVFELSHPSKASAPTTQTARFALTLRSGSPPPGLASALESLIRSKEPAFQWKVLKGEPTGTPKVRPWLWVVGLLAFALLAWALWHRRSTHSAQES